MATYIVPHGRGWKYKRKPPRDLEDVLGHRTWVKTLGAIAWQEALVEARVLAVEHDKLIGALRGLPKEERAKVASKGGLAGFEAYIQATENGAIFVELATRMDPDPESDEATQMRDALDILRGRQAVVQERKEAADGRKILARARDIGSTGLTKLVDAWIRHSHPAPKTLQQVRQRVARFIECVGDLEPDHVRTADVQRFRDALEKRTNLSKASAQKHLDSLHRLYVIGCNEGIVKHNVVSGVKIRRAESGNSAGTGNDNEGKKAFQPQQVRAIFNAMTDESEDFQWVVRLLAYHGMRSGEVAQLRIEDVETVEFGIPVIRIHAKYGSIKNRQSRRDIPIHPACIGIVAYAKSKASRSEWLFDYPMWKTTGRGGKFQQQASKFLRGKAQIREGSLTMHSLRHTWRTLARELNMPEPVSRAIMGHSMGSDDHSGYGGVPSLRLRAEWIAKIDPLV